MRLTSKDVLKYNCEDFLGLVAEEAAKGRDIIFKPPMLGEVFFDYLFCDPNQFLRVKPAFRREFAFERANRTVIGIHFRGTDFPAWNHHAALNFPYYRAAIEFCLEEFEAEKPLFVLFTDDNKYPAYSETVAFLQSLGEKCCFGDAAGLPIHDFYQMSQCDVLVSSPSTFAIWAGCLGKQKRIIHDKAWLEYAVTRNDTFWVRSATRATSYYTIWKTF